MIKEILRNYKFEGKEKDFSKTYDYRELTTKKSVLDAISEFAELTEMTTFEIYASDKLIAKFTASEFRNPNENTMLPNLYQAQKEIKEFSITENILKPNSENKDNIKNIVVNRFVKIVY